jgi:predicted dehydrogenase
MGSYHVRALERLGVTVYTVDCDPSKGAAYRSLEEAPPAEFAVVAVPAEYLADQTAAALQRDMHVLVEKPFAADAAGGRVLCELAASRGLTLAVGYTERANPAVRALREHLNLAGEIDQMTIHREGPPPQSPRAVIADLAVHDIDVLRFLGFSPNLTAIRPGVARATLDLELDPGRATLTVDSSVPYKRRTLTAHGSRATLALDYQARTLALLTRDGAEILTDNRKVHALDVQLEAFLARRPLATGEDGLAVLEVLGEHYENLDSGDDLSVGESA